MSKNLNECHKAFKAPHTHAMYTPWKPYIETQLIYLSKAYSITLQNSLFEKLEGIAHLSNETLQTLYLVRSKEMFSN